MDDVPGRQVIASNQIEPTERLPETAPLGLHLPRARNAIGIGADRKERGIAEIEEPGEANDDIEPERQRSKRECIRGSVDIRVIGIDQREQQCRCCNQRDAAARAQVHGYSGQQASGPEPRQS